MGGKRLGQTSAKTSFTHHIRGLDLGDDGAADGVVDFVGVDARSLDGLRNGRPKHVVWHEVRVRGGRLGEGSSTRVEHHDGVVCETALEVSLRRSEAVSEHS